MKVTQRDLVDTIIGLTQVSEDLRKAAAGQPVEGQDPPAVLVELSGLEDASSFLKRVAEELKNLIPDKVVPTPPE